MRRRKLLSDAVLLYIAHFFRFIFPLLVIPFLARQLGPDRYGLVLVSLSLSALVSLLVDFGFNLSATRDLATASPEELSPLISAIATCKLLFLVPAALVGAMIVLATPLLRANVHFGVTCIAIGYVQGLNLHIYFRARDKMFVAVFLELASQAAFASFIFCLISSPSDAIYVLVCQLSCAVMAQTISYGIMCKQTEVRLVSPQIAFKKMRESSALFIHSAGSASFTAANSLILGWLSSSEQVGFFGPADKFVTAVLQLMGPLSILFLPYIVKSLKEDPDHAFLFIRGTFIVMTGLSVVAAFLNVVLGPDLVSLILGSAYPATGKIVAILGFMIPLSVASQLLTVMLLLPARKDNAITASVLCGGAVNLLSATIFVPSYGAFGMAFSRLLSEATIIAVMLFSIAFGGVWGDLKGTKRNVKM